MKFTFIRSILVGGANTIIGFSVMFLFYHLLLNFILQKFIVFREKSAKTPAS